MKQQPTLACQKPACFKVIKSLISTGLRQALSVRRNLIHIQKHLRYTLLAIFCLTFNKSIGQKKDCTSKIIEVDCNFRYQLTDSLEYKGTCWICTLPIETVILSAKLDTVSKVLFIEGYFLYRSNEIDTSSLGISGADILLVNMSPKRKVKKVKEIGVTLDGARDTPHHDGYFSVHFPLSKGDVLVIGFSGIAGANAFDVGKLLDGN